MGVKAWVRGYGPVVGIALSTLGTMYHDDADLLEEVVWEDNGFRPVTPPVREVAMPCVILRHEEQTVALCTAVKE